MQSKRQQTAIKRRKNETTAKAINKVGLANWQLQTGMMFSATKVKYNRQPARIPNKTTIPKVNPLCVEQ